MVAAERSDRHPMTDTVRLLPPPVAEQLVDLSGLLDRRRSIRRLEDGPIGAGTLTRLIEAVQRTPAAFNLQPWHVVIVRDERAAFWDVIEAGFRAGLSDDRLERYLDRLAGFRPGAGAILIYEDRAVLPRLANDWQISDEQASAFVQQGLGMVQLAMWLALTNEDLVTSLQHWDWLVESRLADFTGIPAERYKLSAIMPIGYAAEPPRSVERPSPERVVSFDRFSGQTGFVE
jgi:predicted oxidoreductase (fatty acid repression mutant protein)